MRITPWRLAFGWVGAALLLAACPARAQYDSDVMNACVAALGSTLACDINGPVAPPPATRQVILHFGAIAVSDKTLRAGASHGQNSLEDAESVAMANCRAMKAGDCKVVDWVQNRCVGLATSKIAPTGYGWGVADDRAGSGESALRNCRAHRFGNCILKVTACAGDDVRFSSPLPLPSGRGPGSVDPAFVGTWQMFFNPGRWIWVVSPNGTYTFHSENLDNAASNVGTFTAKNGHYTLHATNLDWDDQGTYVVKSAGTIVATGKLGTGTWVRISANVDEEE
jgi:hypothetical protein